MSEFFIRRPIVAIVIAVLDGAHRHHLPDYSAYLAVSGHCPAGDPGN